MASEYKRLLKKATKKGWVVPSNNVFCDEVWVRYWLAMDASEKDPSIGRPIAPHRSGGGIRLS
jgi:hypothetical protein